MKRPWDFVLLLIVAMGTAVADEPFLELTQQGFYHTEDALQTAIQTEFVTAGNSTIIDVYFLH